MIHTLSIGTQQTARGPAPFRLPLDAVTQTFAILAKRGGGKTYTAAVMAEEMLGARQRVVVLDPLGVWWGLRSGSAGGEGGYPVVIIGGEHSDVGMTETAGHSVAELAADTRAPALVIDLSGFRKGAQKRFVTDFAETLYHRNRDPLHVFIDEADAFAPQRPQRGEEPMLGAIEDIVRRGRARGLGVTLITQRSAVLNKDVLSQSEVLVALRTVSPQDRDAIDEWVRFHGDQEKRAQLMADLGTLPIGTAYVWSPGWLEVFTKVAIRERHTYDSSATPKIGAPARPRPQLAPIDLAAIRDRMAAAEHEAEANDPVKLRAKVREATKAAAEATAELARVKMAWLPAAEAADLRRRIEELEARPVERVEVSVLTDEDRAVLARIADRLATVAPAPTVRKDDRVAAPAMTELRQTRPRPSQIAQEPREPTEASLRAGARKMLDVLARQHPIRVTKAQWGTLSGMAHTGGTFNRYMSALRSAGYVAIEGGLIGLTEAGLDAAGVTPGRPMTADEIRAQWRGALRAGARAMFDCLVERYPDGMTRDDLAASTEMAHTGGTFNRYLSTLRSNGLVETNDGMVRATAAAVGDL